MEELNLFDHLALGKTTAIVLGMDQESHRYAFQITNQIRISNISCDLYPEPAKFKKQIKYAGNGNYKYAIIIGEEERTSQLLTLKDLESGGQEKLTIEEIISKFQSA